MFLFTNLTFIHPFFFWLLLALPVFFFWYKRKEKDRFPTMRFSSLSVVSELVSWKSKFRIGLPILRGMAFLVFVVAMARPQMTLKEEDIKAEGIDIVMVMDLSSSMLARDFKPDRLEASKKVAAEFINKRQHDRIGLVVFSGEAFTQCPVTTDHKVVKEFLANIECGLLEDGTAIGMGLATAVNRLKDSESKSKIIILLTDGVNNAGYLKPIPAAEIAKKFDVKVYTIGVGSTGQALTPVKRRADGEYYFGLTQVEIDEELLGEISKMTGGRYFRATDEIGLESIYEEIDRLEKTEIEVTTIKRYSEEFGFWVFLGLLFLGLEIALRYSLFRTIP